MKKSNFKYFVIGALATVGIVAASMYSCEKETILPNSSVKADETMPVKGSICGKIMEQSVVDERGNKVADALFYNDTKYFYAEVTAVQNYYLEDAYLHVCNEFSELPLSPEKTPVLEDFNHSITGRDASILRKFKIPLSQMQGQSFVSFAAIATKNIHNNPNQAKRITVWVDGKPFGADKSGGVIIYKKRVCLENEPVSVNE